MVRCGAVQFPSGAMVYHDVMAGWTKTMHLISGSNRLMEKYRFGGSRGTKAAETEERLVAEIEALERQVRCGAMLCGAVLVALCVCAGLGVGAGAGGFVVGTGLVQMIRT